MTDRIMTTRELTDVEREEFLKDNLHGILSFSGDEPYGIPVAYFYRKGTFIVGLQTPGRKMDYLQKSPKVCFTVCRPRWDSPDLKEACTTVVVEGELEKLTDMAYYGLDKDIPEMPENIPIFRIKVDKVGTRLCTTEQCGVFAEPWVSAKAYARRLHEGRTSK